MKFPIYNVEQKTPREVSDEKTDLKDIYGRLVDSAADCAACAADVPHNPGHQNKKPSASSQPREQSR